jgi:ABC-type nitrate/sulfonate/bicarbonate transport system substrate-binding protein
MKARMSRFAAPVGMARCAFLIGLCVLSLAREARASSLLVGYASISPTQTGTWVAKEQGFFGRYGADAEIIPSLDARASVIQLTGTNDPDVAKLRPESVMHRGIMDRLERSGFID